jgi:hypothetical protein
MQPLSDVLSRAYLAGEEDLISYDEFRALWRERIRREAERGRSPKHHYSGRRLAFAFAGCERELTECERTAAVERERRSIAEGVRS